jgi:hypothetical protein
MMTVKALIVWAKLNEDSAKLSSELPYNFPITAKLAVI